MYNFHFNKGKDMRKSNLYVTFGFEPKELNCFRGYTKPQALCNQLFMLAFS